MVDADFGRLQAEAGDTGSVVEGVVPDEQVAEFAAVVGYGNRTRALAARFEHDDDGWRCMGLRILSTGTDPTPPPRLAGWRQSGVHTPGRGVDGAGDDPAARGTMPGMPIPTPTPPEHSNRDGDTRTTQRAPPQYPTQRAA